MQSEAGVASRIPDSAYKNVTFAANPQGLVSDADIVVSVQPPTADIVAAMKDGSVLLSFVYAHKELELTKLLRDKQRSEEHTSEPQSLMRISYAGRCLEKTTYDTTTI